MALQCLWRGCAAPGPFSDDKALFEHLESTHNLAKPRFRCRWAGCARESELRGETDGSLHLITHTGYRPFVCGRGSCKRAFAREDALKRHMSNVHGDTGRYGLGCPAHGESYPGQGRLQIVYKAGADKSGERDEERASDVDDIEGPEPDVDDIEGPEPDPEPESEDSNAHEKSDAERRLERIARLEAALAALEAKNKVEDEAEHDDDWVFYR